jgi:hypothetical protein
MGSEISKFCPKKQAFWEVSVAEGGKSEKGERIYEKLLIFEG